MGAFYNRAGKYKQAAKQSHIVIQLSPNNFKAFRNLGNSYVKMDQNDKVREMYEKSIEIEPNYGADVNLGLLFYVKQDNIKAVRMYE